MAESFKKFTTSTGGRTAIGQKSGVTIELLGDLETRKVIEELIKNNIPNSMAKGIGVAAVSVANDAKVKAPKDTKNLSENIGIDIVKSSNEVTAKVGPTKDAGYGKYVEHGAKRHLAFVGDWGKRHGFDTEFLWVYGSGKEQPFLFPALKRNVTRIKKLIEAALKTGFGTIRATGIK
jgi:hypothetical protein